VKKPRSRRPGRPRYKGPRDASGRLAPKPPPGPTPEAIRHRVEAVETDRALDPLAGYALGRMLIAEQITQAQHDAGIKYSRLRQRMFARTLGITDTPEQDQADKNALRDIIDRLMAANLPSLLALSLLDSVCVDGVEPREGTWRENCTPVLVDALGILGQHYGESGATHQEL
jgi:hypothetical protein